MSRFHKLLLTLLGASLGLYLLTCSSFSVFEQHTKEINKQELVTFVSTELDYELTYGETNMDIEVFVDKALQQALKNNKK
jgi:hypothetical protein